MNGGTDRDWERIARRDPYHGVVTDERYRADRLTEERRREFFQSGADYMTEVLATVRRHIDPGLSIRRALDFGCGVGRLLLPLAKVAGEVTGADVSESMLREARRNCEAHSLSNVVLVKSDDQLTALNARYDFIHSFIVFQHIPLRRGERLFAGLLERLADGGVGVVHFTYAKEATRAQRLATFLRRHLPGSANLINLLRGRPFLATEMQMNAYDLNHLLLAVQKAAVRDCHVAFTQHGNAYGVVLYFRKPAPRAHADNEAA